MSDIFIRDMTTNITRRVTQGFAGIEANGDSETPSISADGRFLSFASYASNLVEGDDNETLDVFVLDVTAGVIEMASVTDTHGVGRGPSSGPSISANGRHIAFASAARLVDEDTDDLIAIYVRDRETRTTVRVSVSNGGDPANATSSAPAISGDGRFVAFQSAATNLIARDFNRLSDIFVRDIALATTERVSIGVDGAQPSVASTSPAISGDGRFVTFTAVDGNLVEGDTNQYRDLFVRDRVDGITQLVSANNDGQPAGDHSSAASVSHDGRVIAFASIAPDIAGGDPGVRQDIFVRAW
jgi:Tol biopolymer transport system component